MTGQTAANISLVSGFLRSSEQFPGRPALEVEGETLSYSELKERASVIAATLQAYESASSLTAVLAHRSAVAFGGILASLMRGHGYVPLNPGFPAERLARMINQSETESLVVGNEALDALEEVLPLVERELVVVLPGVAELAALRQRFAGHTFAGPGDLAESTEWSAVEVDAEDIAYLLFTSGSTGNPKGVPITHANIRYFIETVVDRYDITEQDRLTQMFELVFDLSLFDLFAAWECGACVCCPSKGDAQLPARFMAQSKVTIWFSVPSLAFSMKRMRMLREGALETLRVSLFCGEALQADIADTWQKAAPNSIVENLYGPTEVTLACTGYRWDSEAPDATAHGVVPIGEPLPGLTAIVCDDKFEQVPDGEAGELLMAGPQVAPGYWRDAEKTASAFVTPPGESRIFYRTGDLVRLLPDGRNILYLGRIDHQIKIRGNRVELGEIESRIREASGCSPAVAVGWPVTPAGADGIVAFLQDVPADFDEKAVIARLEEFLPAYMVPSELIAVDDMPLNTNGKIDRRALIGTLGETRKRKTG